MNGNVPDACTPWPETPFWTPAKPEYSFRSADGVANAAAESTKATSESAARIRTFLTLPLPFECRSGNVFPSGAKSNRKTCSCPTVLPCLNVGAPRSESGFARGRAWFIAASETGFPRSDPLADIGYHRLAGVQLAGQTELSNAEAVLPSPGVDESELESRVPVVGVSLDRPRECRSLLAPIAEP